MLSDFITQNPSLVPTQQRPLPVALSYSSQTGANCLGVLVFKEHEPHTEPSCACFQVMWVCNGCRKQQDILTQSGDLDSAHHRSPGVPLPPTHTLLGGPAPLSNGALER